MPEIHSESQDFPGWEEHANKACKTETTLSMLEIGCEQLKQAIGHFYRDEFISAVTLAGAADEVLGTIAKAQAGENAIDRAWQWHFDIRKVVNPQGMGPTLSEVRNDLNRVRNELKHNNGGSNNTLKRRFGYEALQLIDSAVLNLIIIEGFKPPSDPDVARYHLEYPTWNGQVPKP